MVSRSHHDVQPRRLSRTNGRENGQLCCEDNSGSQSHMCRRSVDGAAITTAATSKVIEAMLGDVVMVVVVL